MERGVSAAALGRGAIVVTGSSTGIGRACALGLDRAGFAVFAGVRSAADAEQLGAAGSDRLRTMIVDVTDPAQIEAAAELVREATDGRVAGLVNNAGVTVPGPVEALPVEGLREQLEVNVVGQVAVTQSLLPMIRAARGRIVIMSSIGDRGGIAFLSAYNASKAAISALGDGLRQELAPLGVHVSIVEPGSIATEIWGKGTRAAPRMLAAMTDEQRSIYGVRVERFQELARRTGAAGLAPEAVLEVVEHALTAAKPRARYVVGRDAKVQSVLRKVLSDRAFDWLVARQINR
jgi:NAD(P)-dependent dehydrogenase (short-subunit alcohol dehydrogenase family)